MTTRAVPSSVAQPPQPRPSPRPAPDTPPLLLFTWVWRSYARTALVPLLAVEALLVAVYLLTNTLSRDANMASVRAVAEQSLAEVAALQVRVIGEQVDAVRAATETFRRQTERAFAHPAPPPAAERARHAFTPDGVIFHTTADDGGAASFYSGIVPVDEGKINKALSLAALDPIMWDLKESSPLLVQIYINTWDSYNRIYPYFDVLSQYTPKMDIPSFNFYYEADASHNPSRKVVWTDVYIDPAGQGWMASAIAPVYRGDFLEAVVGLDITVKTIIERVLDLRTPWGGYALLLDRSGTIMALPPAGEKDWGLSELTSHSYAEAIQQDTFKPDAFNVFKRPDTQALAAALQAGASGLTEVELGGSRHLLAWATVPDTGWRLLVQVPAGALYAEARALGDRFDRVGWAMIGGLVVFYLLFFAVLWTRARKAAALIAEPLEAIDAMTAAIGTGAFHQVPPRSAIVELQRTSEAIAVMGRQVGAAADAMRLSRERLADLSRFQRALIDTLPTPVALLADNGGQNLFNEAYADLRRQCNEADMDGLLRSLSTADDGEVGFDLLVGGRTRSFLLRAAGLAVEGHRGRLVVLQDVSLLRQAEADIRAAHAAALDASRMKSDFLATISHEIRTPLNAVVGLGHLLAQSALSGPQRDYVDKMQAASRALLGLVNAILDFSSMESGRTTLNRAPFRLDEVLASLAAVLTPAARDKRLSLTIEPPLGVPPVLVGDAGRLEQVLFNIGGNAIKFTERGGVTVLTSGHPMTGGGMMVDILIRDTGIGMTPDLVATLFRPFTQGEASATRRFGGTGLGLAICRQLVDLMGGGIAVDSTPGAGTTIHLTLPLGIGSAADEQALPAAAMALTAPEAAAEAAVSLPLTPPPPEAAALAERLAPLLLDGDPDAVDLCADLQTLLAGTALAAEAEAIARAAAGFDFPEAAHALTALRTALAAG